MRSVLRDMSVRFAMSNVVALAFFTAVASAFDDLCIAGGQCEGVERAYAAVIQGEACRSIYATGQCSGLCTRSLKAMIGRHLWAKCADRCDWSPGLVAAADSWLAFCLSRPAPGADEVEVFNIVSRRGQKAPEDDFINESHSDIAPGSVAVSDVQTGAGGAQPLSDAQAQSAIHTDAMKTGVKNTDASAASARSSGKLGSVSKRSGKWSDMHRGDLAPWVFVSLRISFVIVTLLLVFLSLSQSAPGSQIFGVTRSRMRGNARSASMFGRTDGLLSPALDTSSRDMASLKRGARRHLKGMRGAID